MQGLTPQAEQGIVKGIVNGPVLKAAQWAAGVNTVHPSLHRLKNALGLTIGLFAGRHTMNLLVGETPSGEKIKRDSVPLPLRPLHGVLAYNHFSDEPNDRWMHVVDLWFPAILGAVGAVAGSHDYALEQPLVQGVKKMLKHPKNMTLDQAESAAIVVQAEPWRVLSGVTSVFGSSAGLQLVPGPTNYGTSLSNSFIGTVARNKLSTPYLPFVQKFWTSNHHPWPYGPTSMLGRMRDYMVHNPLATPEQERQMAYAILEPWFGQQVTQKHVTKFVEELHATRDKFFREGGVPKKLEAECQKELHAMLSGVGLEKTIQKIGLNPETAMIGRNGFMEYVSRLMGVNGKLNGISDSYRAAYRARNGLPGLTKAEIDAANAATHKIDNDILMRGKLMAAATIGGVGGGMYYARQWHRDDNDILFERTLEAKRAQAQSNEIIEEAKEAGITPTPAYVASQHNARVEEERKRHSGLNGKPLEWMEWATDALNSPETLGMHRVSCAMGLTVGGFTGMRLADVLAGRTLSGAPLSIEKVPGVLKKFHGALSYNPQSDHPKDRWGYVMHFLIPAVFATSGVIASSNLFFGSRKKKTNQAEYIDEYENKATMAESQPWTGLTALTSLFVTPSGFGYLPPPAPNYGTALGTRFMLSSGRKAIFPGLGEIWTGTASRYPYGPSALRDVMVKYAVNNPSPNPEQLEEMAIGILKPWFKDVTAEQVHAFVERVHADRDRFCDECGVPEELKKMCEKELLSHFKGMGLEKTLREIGLDPLKATLGENGLSGVIAKHLGAQRELNEINQEFAEKYKKRWHMDAPKSDGAPSPQVAASTVEPARKEHALSQPSHIPSELAASHTERYQHERHASSPDYTQAV